MKIFKNSAMKSVKISAISLMCMIYTNHAFSLDTMYRMDQLITTSTYVDIMVVSQVQEVCNQESIKRNLGGFQNRVLACSFWNTSTCTIIVGQYTNNDILGHELRHCFQGHFH